MTKVNFFQKAKEEQVKFAVIAAKYNGKWIFCKHKERSTYECPGGHREIGEKIIDTAKRELWEETGATEFSLHPICIYSVIIDDILQNNTETFGMLYFADVVEVGELPNLEIERIEFFDKLPTNWTYPDIQPLLIAQVMKMGF